MPKRIKRKALKNVGARAARLAEAHRQLRRAVAEQQRSVSLRRLKQAIEQYNEWVVFQLWLRAVVDGARSIPPVVEQELESRLPGFLQRFAPEIQAALQQDRPGGALWNLVGAWTNSNVFLQPRSERWMEGLIFYASRNMVYIKAWALWDRVNLEWKTNPPPRWPDYREWQYAVAGLNELSNPEGERQRVLSTMDSIPALQWERLLSTLREMTIFAVWMELMLDLEGSQSKPVSEELVKQYPGFGLSQNELSPAEAAREFLTWAVDQIGASDEDVISALNWHIQNGPDIDFMENYASDCHAIWSKDNPTPFPDFQQWRKEAEDYTSVIE
jgi:hypothetical protein